MNKKMMYLLVMAVSVIFVSLLIKRCAHHGEEAVESHMVSNELIDVKEEHKEEHKSDVQDDSAVVIQSGQHEQELQRVSTPSFKSKAKKQKQNETSVLIQKSTTMDALTEIVIHKKGTVLTTEDSGTHETQTNTNEPEYYIEFYGEDEGAWVKVKITNQIIPSDQDHVISDDGKYVYVKMK